MAFQKFAPLMNIEYTLRLASVEGTPKQSQFGKDQVLLRVDVLAPADKAITDASWYSYPWIVEKLQRAGVRAGEPFSFCSAQNGNKNELRIKASGGQPRPATPATTDGAPPVSWDDLTDESGLTQDLAASVAMVRRQRATAPAVVPMAARPAPGAPGPTIHTLASQALAGCLIAAIDASASAIAYAKKKGVPFEPTSQDIQGLASTLFINLSKMGGGLAAMSPNAEQQQLVNGGTKWAQ
jgi:hypothetical protein